MKFDGMSFRPAHHLGWRYAKEGDLDEDGNQVSNNYVVIVRKKDCSTFEKEGQLYYDSADARQHVRLAYSLTNMGYGPLKSYVRFKGDPPGHYTVTVYLVYNGLVYTSTIRHAPADAEHHFPEEVARIRKRLGR